MENNMKIVLQRLSSLEERVGNLEKSSGVTHATGSTAPKPIALKEYILSKQPTNDVQKTLAIGYYLEKFSGLTLFNISDLEKAYERAKENKPSNMNDKVNMNIRTGHMEEATEKKDNLKAWYLTNSGESYVENNFKAKK